MNRRSFFGWLAGAVASVLGIKAAEPETPWYLGNLESLKNVKIESIELRGAEVECQWFDCGGPFTYYIWDGNRWVKFMEAGQ